MEIKIQKAVLHILDSEGALPVYSQEELDLSEEAIYNFIFMHIKKICNDDTSKMGQFNEDSFFLSQVSKLTSSFLESSIAIATYLYDIMKKNSDIPSADLLVAMASIDDIPHVAVIKFNYKEGYTHYVDYNDTGTNNKIIVHKVIFASENQKNDEGALINLNDLSLRVVEKAYDINGDKQYYFSELFLACETDLSPKDSIKVINEVAKDISERYYNGNFQKVSAVKAAIHDSVEVEGSVNVDTIAETCFKDSHSVQQEYLQKVKEAGVPDKISFSGDSPERKFNKHKIKTDNGIEISMPMDVYKNKDMIEFINSADGTISIILKNITRIVNK